MKTQAPTFTEALFIDRPSFTIEASGLTPDEEEDDFIEGDEDLPLEEGDDFEFVDDDGEMDDFDFVDDNESFDEGDDFIDDDDED